MKTFSLMRLFQIHPGQYPASQGTPCTDLVPRNILLLESVALTTDLSEQSEISFGQKRGVRARYFNSIAVRISQSRQNNSSHFAEYGSFTMQSKPPGNRRSPVDPCSSFKPSRVDGSEAMPSPRKVFKIIAQNCGLVIFYSVFYILALIFFPYFVSLFPIRRK
jgi:hypothetical protein